jgi:hypothetical protein
VSAAVFFNSASELATLTNTFSVNGVLTAPSSVTLTVTSPTNVTTTPATTSPSTGVYTADITCDEDGTWQYLWVGTGTATDAQAGTWQVVETSLGKLYCPIESLKSRLGIEHNEADFELHAACFAASRWIEQYTERVFYRTAPSARTFPPGRDIYCLKLPAYCDLVSITNLKTDTAADGTFATTWSASDYQLLPYNTAAAPEQLPYNEIRAVGGRSFPWLYPAALRGIPGRRDLIQITGTWGWPKVPTAIRQAAAIIAADTFKLKDSPFGVEGQGEFTVNVGENRRALKFLDPYRRYSVLVA